MIDAHLHIWDTSEVSIGWITEAGLPARAEIPENPADHRFILVEADADDPAQEAQRLIHRAQNDPRVYGIIAGVDPRSAHAAQTIRQLAQVPDVVGIRHVLQDDALLSAAAESPGGSSALHQLLGVMAEVGLPFDACVRAWELPALTRVLTDHPEVTVVLDHLGKPPLQQGTALDQWFEDLARLAELPQLRCKLSGLPAEAANRAALDEFTAPLIEHAIEVFGPERCLIGSDSPVSGESAAWFRRLEGLIPSPWRDQITETTAALTYRRRG